MARQKILKLSPQERIKNFNEVSLGFSKEQTILEAKRCLQCREPKCVEGCPVEIDIPKFIRLISESKFDEAISKIKEKNNLPAICGRVCPQEEQCEKFCILGKKDEPIAIGALERFAADWEIETKREKTLHCKLSTINSGRPKVAVVGSGPAGLTCSADLAKMGYKVVLFESLHKPGGVLTYGIPEFRLPKSIVSYEIENIRKLGVEIILNTLIGKTYTLSDLFEQDFKAIFIGAGAGLPQFLGIPGENLNRVYSANEFLTRINLMKTYLFPEYSTPINIGERIAVIGGGNVAFDCARCAIRLGKKVTLVYRRTEEEMPARDAEINNAKEEGLDFKLLTQPVRVIGDDSGYVKGLECIRMELGPPDESGRRRPIPIEVSNFVLDVDTLIVAIGQSPNPLIPKSEPDLKINKDGTIKVDKDYRTSIKGVFAGGDIITGADTVISAMGAGKRAARAIDNYIKNL
ncbi:MAG: NADPH-dependent glutamate synthase [Candidatus Omnitrophica bacterium]|nr:NADPH-dependent glutamate synthase [Candidatus Omnitrophota bacterium]